MLSLLVALAPLSLSVTPGIPRNVKLQKSLVTMLELMGETVLIGRDSEATCPATCIRVLVRLGGKDVLLVARRGAERARVSLEIPGPEYGFDQIHALALQIRDLAEQLPPSPTPHAAARAPPVQPPAAVQPEVAVEKPVATPAEPVDRPGPSQQAPRGTGLPLTQARPPDAAPQPMTSPVRPDSPFAVGAGLFALLSRDRDFQMQGLLLTTRFPIFKSLDGRLSVGLSPSRLRTGAAGRRSIHVLPFEFDVSAPLLLPQLRIALGIQLVDASIDYVTGELDSATAWSLGAVSRIEARLPVGTLLSFHLGVGVGYQPFRQEIQTGSAVPLAYPAWSFLGTLALELTLRR